MLTERERRGLAFDSYKKLTDADSFLRELLPDMNRLLWLGEPDESPGDEEMAGLCVATSTVGVFGAEAVSLSTALGLERFESWVDLFFKLVAERGWRVGLPRSSSEFVAMAQRDDFRGAFLGSEFDGSGIGHMISVVPNCDGDGMVGLSWLVVDSIRLKDGEVVEVEEGGLVEVYAASVMSTEGQRAVFVVLAGEDDGEDEGENG